MCASLLKAHSHSQTHTLLLSSLEEQAGNKNLVVAQILFWDQIFNFVHTFLIERSMFIDDMQYNMNDTHSQEKNEYVVVDRILLEDMCTFLWTDEGQFLESLENEAEGNIRITLSN